MNLYLFDIVSASGEPVQWWPREQPSEDAAVGALDAVALAAGERVRVFRVDGKAPFAVRAQADESSRPLVGEPR